MKNKHLLGKIRCDVCGKWQQPISQYFVTKEAYTGFFAIADFSYDAMNCERCGCQMLLKERVKFKAEEETKTYHDEADNTSALPMRMTNKEKFAEVFGVETDLLLNCPFDFFKCPHRNPDDMSPCREICTFWLDEYIPPEQKPEADHA